MSISKRRTSLALTVALLSLAGCSTERYRYIPASAIDSSQGRADAVYDLPGSTGPVGTVRVFSVGVVNLRKKGESSRAPALHLRMTVSNGSAADVWTLNTDEQTVTFANQTAVPPIAVNSDHALPKIDLQPRDLRTLDLYFALPPSEESASDVTDFSFHWAIHSGAQVIQQLTLFKRVPLHEYAMVTPYPYGPYPLGWGPVWYGRAWYPR